MKKSTQANSERQAPSSLEPSFQLRDFRIPAEIIELVRDQTINHSHAFLFACVDHLVNCKGEGCWASKKYLAALTGLSERQVQRLIQDGLRLGLLKEVGHKRLNKYETRRVLETAWSRMMNICSAGRRVVSPNRDNPSPNNNTLKGIKESNTVRSPQPPPASSDDADLVADPTPSSENAMPTEPTWGSTSSQRADPHPAVVSIHYRYADQLIEAAKGAHKVRRVARLRSARSFASLLRSLGGDEARLQRVLDWYCSKGIKGEYAVQAWCGESFAKKFDQIEAAMTRDQSRRPDLVISIRAQNIVTQLTTVKTWPDEGELTTAVQSSLNVLNGLRAKLLELDLPSRQQRQLAAFRDCLLKSDELVDPGWFVFNWFKGLRRWMGGVGYAGRLTPLAVRLDNERFVTHMRGVAAKFHDSILWDELTEAIK